MSPGEKALYNSIMERFRDKSLSNQEREDLISNLDMLFKKYEES